MALTPAVAYECFGDYCCSMEKLLFVRDFDLNADLCVSSMVCRGQAVKGVRLELFLVCLYSRIWVRVPLLTPVSL